MFFHCRLWASAGQDDDRNGFELAKWTVYCLTAPDKRTNRNRPKGWRRAAMQGKVALEEHFAIAETLQDSAGFAPEADWPELKGRLLDIQDRRLREMDAHGIEMMLLSLNAPAVQAIPNPREGQRNRAPLERLHGRANRPPAEALCRSGRAADANARTCDARADALCAGTRLSRRAGQRLQPGGRQSIRHLLRRESLLAVLGRGRAARRAVLSASAKPAAEGCRDLRRPPLAARSVLGFRA